jgi:hypothetical protein
MRLFLAILSIICICLITIPAFCQPTVRTGMLKNTSPKFILSRDEQTLALFETTEKDERWAKLLNLTDWSIKPTIVLTHVTLTPELTKGYWNWVKHEKFEGSAVWDPFKHFSAYYFSDLRIGAAKLQWPDKNFILGVMPDGNLVTASDVDVSKEYPTQLTIKGINITEPSTGKTIKKLFQGSVIKTREWTWQNPTQVIDNGTLLVWDQHPYYTSVDLHTGAKKNILLREGIQGYTGQLGICIFHGTEFGDPNTNRKIIVDVRSGQFLYDSTTVNVKTRQWAATSQDGSIYTLDEASLYLQEEAWDHGRLLKKGGKKLEGEGVILSDVYHQQGYKFIVAKAAGKILLIPQGWKKKGDKLNEMYAWDLATGKLVYKVVDFFSPHEHFLTQQNAPPAAPLVLQPNSLVQQGGYYVLLSQDTNSKEWSAIELMKDRHGMFERKNVQKPASFFPNSTRVISTTPCAACGGGGTVFSTQQRQSSTVDNYNAHVPGGKVITTTTTIGQVKEGCNQCKGTGFQMP